MSLCILLEWLAEVINQEVPFVLNFMPHEWVKIQKDWVFHQALAFFMWNIQFSHKKLPHL